MARGLSQLLAPAESRDRRPAPLHAPLHGCRCRGGGSVDHVVQQRYGATCTPGLPGFV
jgi:hypothetical protein